MLTKMMTPKTINILIKKMMIKLDRINKAIQMRVQMMIQKAMRDSK